MDKENVIIFRNSLGLPTKYIKYDPDMNLHKLLFHIESLAWCDERYYFRFRRIEMRKNGTYRPNALYTKEEMELPFSVLLGEFPIIYLEQSTGFLYDGLEGPKTSDSIFITIRYWSGVCGRPVSFQDMWVSSRFYLNELKELLGSWVQIPTKEMSIFEEVNAKEFNLLKDNLKLIEYNIASGSIIYVEPKPKYNIDLSLCQQYYISHPHTHTQHNIDKMIAANIKSSTPLKNSNDLSKLECKCCYDKQIDCVFLPCGHAVNQFYLVIKNYIGILL